MIHIKKISPTFTTVITTADVYDKDQYENGLIVAKRGTVKEFQKVLYVGDTVKNIKEGDLVHIDPIRYAVFYQDPNSVKANGAVKSYNIPQLVINGVRCFKITQADVDFIVDDWDEAEEPESASIISLKDDLILKA